jgi:hypothetical protein
MWFGAAREIKYQKSKVKLTEIAGQADSFNSLA